MSKPIDLKCYESVWNLYPKEEVNEGYTTPPQTQKRKFVEIPPTPGKKHLVNRTPFEGKRPLISNDLEPLQSKLAEGLNLETIYDDHDTKRNVLKQPEGSKSCWAYSLAMLMTDLERKEKKDINIDNKFWKWMGNAYLLNAEKVQKEAKRINIPLEQSSIPCEDPLKFLRGKISSSGFPVLTSITHPIIQGHAIVVDKVDDSETTIRDPYTGQAWNLENGIAETYYQDVPEKCLSVVPDAI